MKAQLKENLKRIDEIIATSLLKAGRSDSVRLVAVTKTVDIDVVADLYALGLRDFGENRVQELMRKAAALPEDIHWHMIGSLQKNKVNKVLEVAKTIHGVDSLALAEKIDASAARMGHKVECYIQVNPLHEESKHGLAPEDVSEDMTAISRLDNINVKGLMTMAPFTDDDTIVRECFRQLRMLRDEINGRSLFSGELTELSMGMSQDYSVAIEEGATAVRIGSAIYKV